MTVEAPLKEYAWRYASPLGGITLVGDGEALSGLWFDGQRERTACPPEAWLPVFAETVRWLDIYFGGRDPGFTPPLRMRTTPFRKAVWEIMLRIPYGRTMAYGEIAAALVRERGGGRMSAQAVGGAVGHNAIALVIPCHRVIGADGSLTGYGGGLWRKQALLKLESVF